MSEAVVRTVVCVDDDPVVLAAARQVLSVAGFRVLVTSSAAEVLRLLEAEPVDVLVADVEMPEADGVDLVVEVRRRRPDVVRLMLSASTRFESVVRALNEGEVFRFLTKPLDPRALVEAVEAAVARREASARAEREKRVREARRDALDELERRHPGFASLGLQEGAVAFSSTRVRQLRELARGTAFEKLLA